MAWDQAGFQLIYSMTGNSFLDQSMYFLAEYLVLLIPLTLIYLWFQGRKGKEDSAFTFLSTFTGILFAYVLGLFYTHENPSAVYDTIAAYHPENSFPSQHTAAMFAAALPLIYRERDRIGGIMLLAAALTGFSRVYIGEHWPVDILGAVVAGAAGLGITYLTWDLLEPLWSPVIGFCEDMEQNLRSRLERAS